MTETPRHWKPLVKLRPDEMFERPEVVRETMKHYGISYEDAKSMLNREYEKCAYYANALYQVQVAPCGEDDSMLHICIRRRDGATGIRDWRHFQQIKNEIAGEEREAFELYPAESRKVDTSNKYHLWVLPEGVKMTGVGWQERDVQYEERKDVPGLRQRRL